MKAADPKIPLVTLSSIAEQTLFLIREELKSRKFFNTLRNMGLDDCHFQPHLDELILANVGLDDEANETYDFYYTLVEKHSEQIEHDQESITNEALKVYVELLNEKQRRLPTPLPSQEKAQG